LRLVGKRTLGREVTPKGALAANTCKNGLLGNRYRAKYTTTGTYAGNTSVRIDLMTDGLTASP
jgi:hypothetical protein